MPAKNVLLRLYSSYQIICYNEFQKRQREKDIFMTFEKFLHNFFIRKFIWKISFYKKVSIFCPHFSRDMSVFETFFILILKTFKRLCGNIFETSRLVRTITSKRGVKRKPLKSGILAFKNCFHVHSH